MKEHIQKTGVRKYAGDDLIELQAEPLKAIQAFFKEYEDCIINGCEVVPAGSRYNVTPGLVSLRGTDAGGNATAKVAEFAGVADVALPVFLTLTNTVSERVYGDGKVKPVAYNYTAIASGVRPAAGIPCLEITAAGGRRFVDAVKITEKLDKVGNGKDVTVTFAQAATRENIASGEKLTVILGKIIRWLADLKALAFKDKVSKADMDAALQGELDGKLSKGSIIKVHQTQESNYSYLKSEDAALNISKMYIGTCYGYNTPVDAIEIMNGNVNVPKELSVKENKVWHAGNFNPATKEPVFTKSTAFNKNFGTAAGTVCQGNDARLSDSRPANGGNADTVGDIGATSLMRKYMITVGGDSSHLYPCTWVEGTTSVYMSIHSPSLGGGDAYNQNEITFLMSAAGWSDMPKKFMCLEHGVYQPSEITIHSIYQGLGNGMNCIYLRGGAYYTVFSNTTLTPNSSPVTSGIEIFGVMNNDGTVSTTNATRAWLYTEGVSWLGKYGTQTMQGNLTLDTSNASYVSLNRNNESVACMGLGSTTKKDLLFQLYQSGNFIRIGEDGKNYSNNKEIATVDQIKVLSGGATAAAGQYVSGITVNDHEITVTKAALPTSTADIFEVANKKYVTDAEKADWNGKAPANHTHPYAPDNHNHDASYAVKNHTHNYEPAFSKNTAFNRYFGTTAGTVAQGNHTHAGVTTMKAMYEFTIKGIILNKDLKKGTNIVTSSIRNSGGNYTINHNLGHDNYVVILGIGKREDGATLVKAGLIGQDATCFKVQVSWGDQYHDGGFYATILTF